MRGETNFFIVDGYVGQDPDIVIADDPKASRARFRMADTKTVTRDDGQKVEYTEWFTIVAWGDGFVKSVIEPYVKKGSKVQVTGRVQNTRWTDDEGIERFGIEVVCDRLDLLGDKRAATGDDIDRFARENAPLGGMEDMSTATYLDDDLPF